MPLILSALLFTAGLFLGMLVCLDIGWRIGVRRLARDPEGAIAGVGIVEGAVFGLLALLVAFTFSFVLVQKKPPPRFPNCIGTVGITATVGASPCRPAKWR